MDRATVARIVGVLSGIVFTLYVCKSFYIHRRPELPGKEIIYAIKSIVWALVSLSFFMFPHVPVDEGHVLIFVSWAAIIIVELGYNAVYITNMARDIKKWIQS